MTYVRWTWRDFRRHWLALVVVASVIGIGTGVFAGLGSTGTWRRLSNDASFSALEIHDLRVVLSPGNFAQENELTAVAASIPSSASIATTNERLFLGTQVDASTSAETILVGGRVVGLGPGTGPDRLWVDQGSEPTGDDAVLEVKFANTFDLAPQGTVQIAGGEMLNYRGLGSLPTDFYVAGERGDLLAQFNFAVLYTTLDRAQELAGRPGAVNDLVIGLTEGADRDVVERELEAAFGGGSGFSATVTNQDEDEAFRILYTDIENDQRFWNVLSAIVLASAALAAFNLVSRLVESQRREIGVGMALGASRRTLSIRPMLVGIEIAVIGVGLGLIVGVVIAAAMRSLLLDLVPLPIWLTPFQPGVFARAAGLGVAVPLVSAAIPVWRAVRVEPIDAIRTGHLAAKRPPRILRRIRLPGSSISQMPLRNLLRTPRRTALTVLGVAAAITALVAVLGILDSFDRTLEVADQEVTQDHPDRISATLDDFYAVDDPVAAGLVDLAGVSVVDLGVQLPASIESTTDRIDALIEAIDFTDATWLPNAVAGSVQPQVDGLVLSRDAANDLSVGIGDPVVVRHPQRLAGLGFSMGRSDMVVTAIHPNPLRAFSYVSAQAADAWGFGGVTNVAQVIPEPGADRDVVQRLLFASDGVASAQPVTRTKEVFEDAIDQFTGFLLITQAAVVILASLIAFNSVRITVHERTREHATMLGFGAPVRAVVGTLMKEGFLVGILATIAGVAAGYATLRWFVSQLFAETLPELGIVAHLSVGTFLAASVIGVLAVTIAPLFMIGRLRKMDLPSTLRVVE